MSDYGQDSITMLGKFVVMCTSNRIQALPVTALFGSAVDVAGTKLVLPENEDFHEMWECEITIKPIRKFSAHHKADEKGQPSYPFRQSRIEQVLVNGFADINNWGDQYYGKPEIKRGG